MAYQELPDQIDRDTIYNAEVEQPREGGSGVKDALLGMAKFAVGMAVLGTVSKVAAGSLYKNIVPRTSIASGIQKAVGGQVNQGTLNMGGLFKGTRQVLSENPTGLLSSIARGSINAGKNLRSMHTKWSGAGSSLGMKTTAMVGKHLYKAAPIAAGWYGVSRTLGLEHGEKQPSWYNVPGHLGEIAKMTAEFAAFDIGIGGLKKLVNPAKNLISSQFAIDKAPGLHAFMDKHFAITRTANGTKAGSFLEKAVKVGAVFDGLREGSKAFSGHVAMAVRDSFGNKAARDAQHSALFSFTNKAYQRQVKKDTVDAFKTAYRSRNEALHNYRGDYGHDAAKQLTAAIAKDRNLNEQDLAHNLRSNRYEDSLLGGIGGNMDRGNGGAIFGNKTMRTAIENQMHLKSQRIDRSMGGSILHRKIASVRDVMTGADRKQVDNLFSYIEDTVTDSTADIGGLKNTLLGMNAGPGIYKTANGVVDYSMWSPKNLLSSLASYASPFFTVGALGRELPMSKMLPFQKLMAGEGLGIYSIRANEGAHYYDKTAGTRRVGDNIKDVANGNLGGMLVGENLFVMGSDGVLFPANTGRHKMVYSTPYARDSVLNKLNAEAATSAGSDIQRVLELQREHHKGGFAARVDNFASRWGLQLPTPINWVAEKLGQTFGFGVHKVGVDQTINKLMDPRSTVKSLGGDMKDILNIFSDLGDQASKDLYQTLSNPETLRTIGRLSKDVGGDAADRVAALSKALRGTDGEVMSYISKNRYFETDNQLQYAMEHYGHFKSSGLTEQMSTPFSFRKIPLTKRQEINRNLLNKTLGMQGYPQTDAAYSAENIARRMLDDNEVIRNFSQDQLKNLKALSTRIDLFRFGYLDGSGNVAANYADVAKKDAIEIIRDSFKNETHYLQTKLFDTRPIKSMNVIGLGIRSAADRDTFLNSYSQKLSGIHDMKIQASPFMLQDAGGGIGLKVNSMIDRVMGMGNFIGLKYGMEDKKPYVFKIPELFSKPLFGKKIIQPGKEITLGGPMASMMKRIAQGVGVMAAAQAVDTFTDVNPMFNGTILDKGIFSAAADVYVKGSMAYHKVQDLTGITEAAKYLEGLMPSSTSTIPGAVIGGFAKGPLGILPGAVINRFMGANGVLPNFDKSYEEMKDTYSGRELVPIRRNRFWLFSKAPYEGDAPQYFRPHWYPRLKSQYKYTDTLYGSKAEAFVFAPWAGLGFNPIGHVIDKYHYEKKHYWDRAYPVSAPAFSEVPIIGKLLSATIGKLPIIGKPIKHMHMDQMSSYYSMDGMNTSKDGEFSSSNMPKVTQTEQILYQHAKQKGGPAETALRGSNLKAMNPYGTMTVLGEQLYNFTELAGLRGFQLESMMGGGLADKTPRLSNASDMWSARRAFWDLSAGDIFGSCFIKGTKVITENGRKPIENIQIGDDIVTIDGSIKKVIGKLKKEQQSNIYELKCSTVDVVVNVTEKHHFPIYKRYPCHNQNQRPCVPGNKKHCKICTKIDKNIIISDIAIENISKGDFLCLPIIQSSQQNILLNGKIITPDIAYFLGWYVTEGCCEKYRVSMTMNINEIEYANRIAKIIKDNFGKNVQIYTREKDSKLSLRFSDKDLALELKTLFGHGAKNKYIPYKIKTLPTYILKEFFKGCVLGAGFCNLKTTGFTSASSDLCRDLFDVGLSLGFIGHLIIDYHEKGKGIMPQGTPRKDSIRSYISWNQVSVQIYNLIYNKNEDIKILKKNSKSFIHDNKLFVQVKSNNKVNIISDVYDLEIEEKHYYMVEHIVTHNTEFFRRFVPRDKKIWQKVNPLRNKMAPWLPSEEGDYFTNFLNGDPYTKIPEGEMRLPGDAYNKLYDVKRTFPGRASSLGAKMNDLVRSMTGLSSPFDEEQEEIVQGGTAVHRYVQDALIRANVGYKAEPFIYDSKNDITGHIDLLMYDPNARGGKKVLEIKTISKKGFSNLKGPKAQHLSQVNFYLHQMQMDMGSILYINREDPSQIRTFDIRYSQEQYRRDIADLQKARKIAAGLIADGKGFETGTSYSWLDRFRILADVAPYSPQYRDAAEVMRILMKENRLSEAEKEEVAKIRQRRKSVMRKFDLYPTRFKNRVFNPDTTYELWSENTNIKAAAEYSFGERLVGAAWERAIQMDTPLNNKLWNYKSPLQHYRSTKIYGTESAAWNRPMQDFLKPMATKALSANNPIDAAASFGWIGGLGMGGMGNMALPGAVFGGLYGAAKAVVGDDSWIPDEVNKKRQIEQNFDELRYQRAMYMFNSTGDMKYKTEAYRTMTHIKNTGYDVGVGDAMRALSPFEKPYFLTWMKETNPIEREKILDMVPEDVGNLLKSNWGLTYDPPSPSEYNMMMPNSEWEGLMPDSNLDDIQLKTIEQAGLRTHDFGLGWYDQQRRIALNQFELNPVTKPSQVMVSNNAASQIKTALMRTLTKFAPRPLIAISINPAGEDTVVVNLHMLRDRFNELQGVLRGK